METIGLVVNPVAGMGGRVGLKGTDGRVDEAVRRGAEQRAPARAREALEALYHQAPDVELLTAGGPMGATIATSVGFDPRIVHEPTTATREIQESDRPVPNTTAEDTKETVRALLAADVDLILFVGGDGTAADVTAVLDDCDSDTPVLGVPAGVKIYSAVFAVTPAAAGRIVADFDRVEDREVMDIDETAYREGVVETSLVGVVPVPVAETVQTSKQLTGASLATLAEGVARTIEPTTTYVFGPGGTVGAIQRELGCNLTPLGVDVYRDGECLVVDGTEADLLGAISTPTVIVVSPIGGQGFVFGRGNQQISPAIIRQADEIMIVAAGDKLDDLDVLRVDTGDPDLDDQLRGWHRVRTGRFTTRLIEIV